MKRSHHSVPKCYSISIIDTSWQSTWWTLYSSIGTSSIVLLHHYLVGRENFQVNLGFENSSYLRNYFDLPFCYSNFTILWWDSFWNLFLIPTIIALNRENNSEKLLWLTKNIFLVCLILCIQSRKSDKLYFGVKGVNFVWVSCTGQMAKSV